MKLMITSLCLCFSIYSFGQDISIDDYQKGGIEIGSTLTDLSIYSLDSTHFSAAQLQNKVTLINYWFVGCGGCRQEEDFLKEISEYFSKNEKVQFLSITPSTSEKVKDYFTKYGDFGFPVYPMNGFKKVKKDFNVKTFPHHQIVVNGAVTQNFQIPIARENMKADLIAKIEEELKKLD